MAAITTRSYSSSDEPSMPLEPLSTPSSRRQVLAVQDAFSCFWDQAKFKSGLAAPPVAKADVAHLIKRAAEYVVYIQQQLESEGELVPVLQGCAKEMMWCLDWNPLEEPDRFVRALVHSAFKDQNGYVADLSEEVIDEYIAEIDAHYACLPSHHERHPANRSGSTSCDWVAACGLAQQLVERLMQVQTLPPSAEHHPRWLNICRVLEHTNHMLKEILSLPSQQETNGHRNTPNTDHEARRARRKRRRLAKTAPTTDEKSPKRPLVDVPTPLAAQTDVPETQDKVEQATKEQTKEHTPQETEDATVTLQIGKVQEDVEKRKEDIRSLVEESALLGKGNTSGESTETLIQKLQQRCLESSESLMRDLLALDQLVVSSSQQRQQRKAQVVAIQDMLDTTDRMSQQLSSLLRDLRSQRKEQSQEPGLGASKENVDTPTEQQVIQEPTSLETAPNPAGQGTQGPASTPTPTAPSPQHQGQRAVAIRTDMPVGKESTKSTLRERLRDLAHCALHPDTWRKVKMEPTFEVSEHQHQYVIQAHLPGVSTKDISVDLSEDDKMIIVSGCRAPNSDDVRFMLGQLIMSIQRGSVDPQRLSQLTDEQLLLLVGAGRYGSFVQRYRLPDNVDRQAIEARMDRGVLKVTLGKVTRSRSPPLRQFLYTPYSPLLSSLWSPPTLDDLFW